MEKRSKKQYGQEVTKAVETMKEAGKQGKQTPTATGERGKARYTQE